MARVREAATATRPRRSVRPALIAGLALAAVVALTAVLGGFGTVPRQTLPTLGAGRSYTSDTVTVTVRSWSVTDVDPISGAALDAPVVAATADLRYTGDGPALRADDWLRPLDIGVSAGSGSIRSTRDGSFAPPVQPDLPIRVVYTWPLPKGSTVQPGATVRLGVFERYAAEDLPLEGVTTPPILLAVYARPGS